MTRDELTDRIEELFPALAESEQREWSETSAGEPFVVVEGIGFTGLAAGAIEVVGPIPDTGLVAVYEIEPANESGESRFKLVGLTDDPAAGMQATLN